LNSSKLPENQIVRKGVNMPFGRCSSFLCVRLLGPRRTRFAGKLFVRFLASTNSTDEVQRSATKMVKKWWATGHRLKLLNIQTQC